MSWLYSQVLVEEFSGDISWDGAPSALWNGTPTQHPSWCTDKTMAHCRLSRSGMTFKPLMDDLGEGVLMSFLEAFPARTYPAPEKEQGLTGRDQVCGDTWRELLVKFDQSSAWWKTAHCLWEEALPESSVTLPRWGMMRSGECWEREMPEHLTSGTGSGLLESYPTPNCFDAIPDFGDRQDNNLENGGRHGVSLRHLVKMWPTPTKDDAVGNLSNCKPNQFPMLRRCKDSLEQMWPTPVSTEARQGYQERREGAKGSQVSLSRVAIDQEGGREVHGSGPGSGQLNPTWTEAYLMGWPIAWTSMEPMPKEVFQEWERTFLTGSIVSNALETDKCPTAQPWPGES